MGKEVRIIVNEIKSVDGVKECYFAGGTVRDIINSVEPRDYDFYVIADNPRKVADRIAKRFSDMAPIEIKIGEDIVLIFPGWDVRITRSSGVLDKDLRHYSITSDFTANSLLMTANGKIIDPLGVISHVRRRILYPVRDNIFIEEPRTILRAYRLSIARDFKIIRKTALLLTKVPGNVISSIDPMDVYYEFSKAFNESPEYGLRFFKMLINERFFDRHKKFKECNLLRRNLKGYKHEYRWTFLSEYPPEFVYATFFIPIKKNIRHIPDECKPLMPELSQLLLDAYFNILFFGASKRNAISVAVNYGELLERKLFSDYFRLILPRRLRRHIDEVVNVWETVKTCVKEEFNDDMKTILNSRRKRSRLRKCVLSRLFTAENVTVDADNVPGEN